MLNNGNLRFEKATEVEPEFWQNSSQIMSISKTRDKNAGLKYFQPRAYRHLAINRPCQKQKTAKK
jgi:hypothetical protein